MSDPTPTPTSGGGRSSIYAAVWQEGYETGFMDAQKEGKANPQPAIILTDGVRRETWKIKVPDVMTQEKATPNVESHIGVAEFAKDPVSKITSGVAARYREAYLQGYIQGFNDSRSDLQIEKDKLVPPP